MKRIILSLLFVTCSECIGEAAPNFVVILGEGAGWTSSSVQMDDRNPASKGNGLRTKNLERLATAGMRFSDGYAASPRCTPSRAALFTGRSPAALHMTFIGDGKGQAEATVTRVITPRALLELPEAETTIGELLKRTGYATAHFGKWHVGRVHPSRHGFEESDGPTSNGGPDNVANPNPKQAIAMTAKGIEFMERQAGMGRPFYLQLSQYPSQEEKGSGRNHQSGLHDEEIGTLDKTIGQILDAIERLGLQENTYVLYTTDHGTPGRNAPLTGGKGTVSEGGLRVPFIVKGPGVRAGECSHVRVSATDILPTFAELAGVKDPLPNALEGGSFASVLLKSSAGTVSRPREEMVIHFPHYDKDTQGPASAILLGDYKLIRVYETNQKKLFDLSKDIAERHDLANLMATKVTELDQRLTDYLQEVNAQMPSVNPDAKPGQRPPERKGGNRKLNSGKDLP